MIHRYNKKTGAGAGPGLGISDLMWRFIMTTFFEKSEEGTRRIIKVAAFIFGKEKVIEFANLNKNLENWVPWMKDVFMWKFKVGGHRAEVMVAEVMSEFNDRLKAIREGKFDFGTSKSSTVAPVFAKKSGGERIALALAEIVKYPELFNLINKLSEEMREKFNHHFRSIPNETIPGYVESLSKLEDEAFKKHVESLKARIEDVVLEKGKSFLKKFMSFSKKQNKINGKKRSVLEAIKCGSNLAKTMCI